MVRQGIKRKETPWATWFIEHDEDSQNYAIKGYWEKSADGKIWNHDFDLTYKKTSLKLRKT